MSRQELMGVMVAVLVLAGGYAVISRGKGAAAGIGAGFAGIAHLASSVQDEKSWRKWLMAWVGLWIVLTFIADAGAGEFAETLAGVIFFSMLLLSLMPPSALLQGINAITGGSIPIVVPATANTPGGAFGRRSG